MSNKKLKVALIGAGGRMGKSITQVLSHSEKLALGFALEKSGSILLGMDSGVNSGIKENGILYTEDLHNAISHSDIIIDFSSNLSTIEVLKQVLISKKPIVIGTTGLGEPVIQEITRASVSIPIVHSPNMSIGVNLLFKLVEMASSVLKDNFDIEILDIHHRHKKDAPSGTAQKLKEILLETLERSEKNVIYGREGLYEERSHKEIAIHTMRAGEVVGEHTVYFFSPEERLEIRHAAQDRKTFAVGAVRAAEFISEKKHGLFDMYDVLGL